MKLKIKLILMALILTILLNLFLPRFEPIGLFLIGLTIGLNFKGDFSGAILNASIIGTLAIIISTALNIFTLENTMFIFTTLIYYVFVMAVSGGLGSLIVDKITY